MKILHVSNFGDKHNGRLYWNQCYKISNGFIRNGHNVYNFSERDRSRSDLLNKFNNNKKLQLSILETVKIYHPDVVLLGHADRIHLETLEQIRSINPSIKIAEWNVDNYMLDNTEHKLKTRSRYVDGIFSTTADKKLSECLSGNFITFFPNIVDPTIEKLKIFNNSEHNKDIFFALSHGVGTGKLRKKNTKKEINDPRVIFAKEIIAADIEVKCNFFGFNNIGPVWAEEFNNEISSCYMGLCLQRKPQLKYCLSDRIAQYGGNGLMLFIEKDTQFNEFLNDNEEAVFFDDIDDLLEKVIYYKKNKVESLKIAEAGYNKLHTYCNEKVVTNYFLDCLFSENLNNLKTEYSWPIHFYK
jgi:hypothetical protein